VTYKLICLISRCVGTTPDGRSFDEFLGKDAYREWLGKLDSFFEACSGKPFRSTCIQFMDN
jgi:hypothetical protein